MTLSISFDARGKYFELLSWVNYEAEWDSYTTDSAAHVVLSWLALAKN